MRRANGLRSGLRLHKCVKMTSRDSGCLVGRKENIAMVLMSPVECDTQLTV